MQNRIEVFTQMLASDANNTMVLFGLANEYLKIEDYPNAIATLVDYLHKSDDEGAAYGMLAKAYEKIGEKEKAKNAYAQGVVAAEKHGHPSMSEEFQEILDSEYAD
jgi:predicted Zn-dependent protease